LKQQIRKWENENNVKKNIIIALTANEESNNKEMFTNSGFNGFLSKPVVSQELEDIVKVWLPG